MCFPSLHDSCSMSASPNYGALVETKPSVESSGLTCKLIHANIWPILAHLIITSPWDHPNLKKKKREIIVYATLKFQKYCLTTHVARMPVRQSVAIQFFWNFYDIRICPKKGHISISLWNLIPLLLKHKTTPSDRHYISYVLYLVKVFMRPRYVHSFT